MAARKKKGRKKKPSAQSVKQDMQEMAEEASKENEPVPYNLREAMKVIESLRRKADSRQLVTEVIKEAVETVFVDYPPEVDVPNLPPASKKKHLEIPCTHWSDLHFGKHTQTYNTEIAASRMMSMAEKIVQISEMRRSNARIDELRIYLGGDIVEGERIFEKQILHIDTGVFEQAVRTTPIIIARVILYLLKHFRKVTVHAIPGNHGRVEPSRKAPRHPLTDWDRVCYEVTRLILLGHDEHHTREQGELRKRLTFEVSDTWYFVDRVFDWGNLVVHGHEIRGGFAGFPWYGTAKKAWGWNDVIPELERIHERYGHWDYLWFGHFHTYAYFDLNYKTICANGTLESHNAFAAQELAAAGPACQRLSFFNRTKGLISDNQLKLEEPVPSLVRAQAPFKGEIVGPEWAGL